MKTKKSTQWTLGRWTAESIRDLAGLSQGDRRSPWLLALAGLCLCKQNIYLVMEIINPNDDFVWVHLINGSPNIFSTPHFHHQIYTKLCRFRIKFEMRWSFERRRGCMAASCVATNESESIYVLRPSVKKERHRDRWKQIMLWWTISEGGKFLSDLWIWH